MTACMSVHTLRVYVYIFFVFGMLIVYTTTKMSTCINQVKEQKGFKLVHLNSRSIIQHFDELNVTFLDGSLDVVIFTESWLHANCTDSLIAVPGFCLYRLDRRVKSRSGTVKRGGGIVVYVKDGINVTTWQDIDVSDENLECISLTCKQGMRRNVNITCVY